MPGRVLFRLMYCLLPQLVSILSDSPCVKFLYVISADYIVAAVKANYPITVALSP